MKSPRNFFFMFSVLFALFSTLSAHARDWRAAPDPAGSYLKSCSNITVRDNVNGTQRLVAQCYDRQHTLYRSILSLPCAGDIMNDDGLLVCDTSKGKPNATAPAVLFEHSNFQGRYLVLDGPVASLQNVGFNDRASSLQIRSGRWEVCSERGFNGTCRIFDASVSNFKNSNFNDVVSSIRPANAVNQRKPSVILYQHAQFEGASLEVENAIPNLQNTNPNFNDIASSIKIERGRWEVCSDADFHGNCRVINASASSFDNLGLNDQISSIRPASDVNTLRPRVILFEHDNFRGKRLVVEDNITNFEAVNFNDITSSVQLERGRWEICTDKDFRGTCRVVEGSALNLQDYNINDAISSIRLLR